MFFDGDPKRRIGAGEIRIPDRHRLEPGCSKTSLPGEDASKQEATGKDYFLHPNHPIHSRKFFVSRISLHRFESNESLAA
jgi:hypothetical protein